jgi:hypothetical protein
MILAYAIILLVLLALLLRRDLSAIGRISYKGGWKFISIVVGLFLLQDAFVIYLPGQTLWQMVILMASPLALMLLFLLNHHLPGAKLFALGIALNVVVMVANGGWMPITPQTYHFVHPNRPVVEQSRPANSKNIVLPQAETNLWILSDIIPVTLPWRRYAVSLGDVLLIVAVAQFIFQTTAEKNTPQPTTGHSD